MTNKSPTTPVKDLTPVQMYHVKLVNSYEDFDEPKVTEFYSNDPEHVKTMISAYCAYYSGDPYRCWINGDEALLKLDWGLA